MLGEALDLASMGFRVLPVYPFHDGRCSCMACSSPGKHPRHANWPARATDNSDVIKLWWSQHATDGIGIATGRGVAVIDIDGASGREAFAELCDGSSWLARTGSGGSHHYFSTVEPISNSVRKLGPEIDVRGDGGFVVAPPSPHKSGNYYEWVSKQGSLPPLPPSILEGIHREEVREFKPSEFGDDGLAVWPWGLVSEGDGRNNRMASFVGSLLRQGVSPEDTYGAARQANETYCLPPMPEGELGTILRSIVGREERRCRAEGRPTPWNMNVEVPVRKTGRFHLIKASTLKYMPVDWIWEKRIAAGKITVIDGDPGTGKSGLTLDVAARLSRGSQWPDGSPAYAASDTIVINGEDDPNDTIMPRLVAAGADCERVHVVTGDQNRLPSLPDSLGDLEELVTSVQARLLIIDPIMAFLSTTISSSSDQEVRRALTPLAAMASRTGCAVIVVRHLNKKVEHSALQRGGGSMGIIGAARLGFLLTKDKTQKGRSILSPTKSNLSALADTRAYAKKSTDEGILYIEWEPDPIEMDADEAIGGSAERDQAVQYVRARLTTIPMPLDQFDGEARGSGISAVSLAMAKQALGVSVTTNKNGVRMISTCGTL